jgi:hypothetical protein
MLVAVGGKLVARVGGCQAGSCGWGVVKLVTRAGGLSSW